MNQRTYDMVIVGAGTAGLSAAIYGVRAGKKVMVLDAAGYGGQIIKTTEIENYPGIQRVSGYEFATGLYQQATQLGAEVSYEKVEGILDCGSHKCVKTSVGEYFCGTVILATGATNRPLGLEHEERLTGAGVSYCATCDGAFFKNREVAVVGGGSTALGDALFLANYCSRVYLIHRRDTFRGEEKILASLKQRENVVFLLECSVVALKGENRLEEIAIKNNRTQEIQALKVDGLFVAIGQMPQNEAFQNVVELDANGYIVAGEDCRTKTEGIFAAGDCRTKQVRQLATAAADGAVAGLAACEYIDANGEKGD